MAVRRRLALTLSLLCHAFYPRFGFTVVVPIPTTHGSASTDIPQPSDRRLRLRDGIGEGPLPAATLARNLASRYLTGKALRSLISPTQQKPRQVGRGLS